VATLLTPRIAIVFSPLLIYSVPGGVRSGTGMRESAEDTRLSWASGTQKQRPYRSLALDEASQNEIMGTLRGIVRFLWWPACLPTIRRRDATPQNMEQHTGTVYAVLQAALKKMPSNEFTRVCLVRCILRECPGTFPSILRGYPGIFPSILRGYPGIYPSKLRGYLDIYPSILRGYPDTYPSILREYPGICTSIPRGYPGIY